jgi:hypothetical protein
MQKPAAAVTHLACAHVDNAPPFHRDGGHLEYDYVVIQDSGGDCPKA